MFLDEPASGLDPMNSRVMKNIILEKKHKGETILLPTHIMQDAAELCNEPFDPPASDHDMIYLLDDRLAIVLPSNSYSDICM